MSAEQLQHLRVGADADGQRLDVVLAQALGRSRSAAAALIAAGRVRLDGRVVAKGTVVTAGAAIEVDGGGPTPTPQDAPPLPPVLYRDEHLLVVAKPAGLVVHPGAGHAGDTLVDACRAAGIPLAPGPEPERPGVVHRLDRDTSGLLLLASSEPARVGLIAALRDRAVSRRYLTLVVGGPRDQRGRVEGPIGRDPRHRTRFAVVEGGKPAATRFRVLERGTPTLEAVGPTALASLVCELETGRTHQIRVHLAALGAPVAGDRLYGARPAVAAALGLERPALHAAALSFVHPVTGARIDLVEPLPDDLVAAHVRAGLTVPSPDARA